MPRGSFIVIEGGDGAGKDTQADLLQECYGDRNDIIFTRDPGGTKTAHAIRQLVLTDFSQPLTPKTELLLFLAARSQLVDELILPALQRGVHVICQRFALSTIAYQLYGRELLTYRDDFEQTQRFATSELVPDLYLLLDIDARVGMERTEKGKGARRDRFEVEAQAFHTRVCEAYRTEVKKFPKHMVIDANRSIDEVFADVSAAVAPLLNPV